MSDDSPPRAKLWDIEGWGLRWKVTAVLAVPVTVAMVLGGLRVESELSEAADFTSAVDQVSVIRGLVDYDASMGTVTGGYISGTGSKEDRSNAEADMATVADEANNPALDPAVASAMKQAVADGTSMLDLMKSPGLDSDMLADRQRALASELIRPVEEIVKTIDDRGVMEQSSLLLAAWQAQRQVFDVAVAMSALRDDFKASTTPMISADGAELGLVRVLARYYPEGDPRIKALSDGIAKRDALMDKGLKDLAAGGTPPILQLRSSLLGSVDIYQELVGQAADDIGTTVERRAAETRTAALRDTAIVLGTLLAALVLALLVSRSLIGPIRRLRYGALQVARRELPEAIDKIKSSDDTRALTFAPIPVQTNEEIGQLARAVDDMHSQALKLAGEQAKLRLQINDMFETLARRSKSLIDQQLSLIEALEFEEKDPRRLESLFRLDHLAARMRRNGENLLILAGTRVRRQQAAPIALGDVLRAAISEVEDYQRVQMGSTPEGALSGAVVMDVVHLLAELVDNALRASPPDTGVAFSFARAVDGGVLLEIADRGIGIPADEMKTVNERLTTGGDVGADTARHMGLFVVSRLSQRHGLTVRMRATFDTARNPGVTVSIHIPNGLIVSQAIANGAGAPRTIEAQPVRQALAPAPSPKREAPRLQPAVVAPSAPPAPNAQTPPVKVGVTTASGITLPKRNPGASGIASGAGIGSAAPAAPAARETPSHGYAGGSQLPLRRPQDSVVAASSATPPAAPFGAAPAAAVPAPTRPRPADARDPLPDTAPSSDGDSSPAVRHRYRTSSAKTASFFQSRIDPPPAAPAPAAGAPVVGASTPIFADMMSDWLTDPTSEEGAPGVWESAGDAGWSAASRVAETPVEVNAEIGLPMRRPGERLLPGTVEGHHHTGTLRRVRNPETIRANLSRHQQGVRNGRATQVAEHNSIEGDR